MTRDHQRQQVYDAERAAFDGTLAHEPVGWDDVIEIVDVVVTHPAWAGAGLPSPRLRRARIDSGRSHATRYPDGWVVAIARGGQNVATVLHELAHVAAGATYGDDIAGHGPEFRGAQAWLIGLALGEGPRDRLIATYDADRLGVVVFPAGEYLDAAVARWHYQRIARHLASSAPSGRGAGIGEAAEADTPAPATSRSGVDRINGAIPL